MENRKEKKIKPQAHHPETVFFTRMLTAALLIKAKKGNKPNAHQLMNGCTKCSIPTAKYYLAKKKNEVQTSAIARMDVENVMLSERSHSQKTTCCMTAFI